MLIAMLPLYAVSASIEDYCSISFIARLWSTLSSTISTLVILLRCVSCLFTKSDFGFS